MKPTRVEISYKTIIFTILFLVSLALLWQIQSIIVLFFVCFIFAEILNPIVGKLEKFKIPRPLGIVMFYVFLLATISFILIGIVPGLVVQTAGLMTTIPSAINKISFFGYRASMIDWSSQIQLLQNLPTEIATIAIGFFSNVFSALVIMVVTFYMLIERKNIPHYSQKLFGERGKEKVVKILTNLELRLGRWIGAELILMAIIGIMSYIGYVILGLNYAIPLALMAGLLEIVPNIGPIVSIFPAALIGLTISPVTALLTIALGIFVHQSEGNLITPKIMKETIGLNPIITIFTIAIGAKLGGIGGALLAVPLYLIIETIIRVFFEKK